MGLLHRSAIQKFCYIFSWTENGHPDLEGCRTIFISIHGLTSGHPGSDGYLNDLMYIFME